MSVRRLALLVLTLALGLVVTACARESAPPAQSPTQAPKAVAPTTAPLAPPPAQPTAAPTSGAGAVAAPAAATPTTVAKRTPTGQIVFASRLSEVENLHPFMARLARAQAVAYHVNEGLTKFDYDYRIVPGLAKSWEVSNDNLVYTFQLREGVKWHDGQAFSSKDVKFTFDAAMAQDSQSAAKSLLQTYVQSVETPDPMKVVLTLKRPYSPLLTSLADQVLILPSHILTGKVYDAAFGKVPIGTGPYKVKEHAIDFLSLEANTDYWGPLPFTQRIILRDAPESAPQLAGLLAGELDVIAYVPAVMANLKAQNYPIYRGAAGSVHGINLDLQNPVLQDVKVRKALWMGLDRERIRALHYTEGGLATVAISPAYGTYQAADLPAIPYDVEGAKKLLDEAGWTVNAGTGIREKGGQPFKIKHYAWAAKQWQDIATIAQASWKQLGVDVEIVSVENALIADTVSGRYDAAPIGWGLTSDPIVGLNLLFRTSDKTFKEGSTRNVFHYSNAKVDALLEEGLATADYNRRTAIARDIQKQVYDDAPFLAIAYPVYELATRPDIILDEDKSGKGVLSGVGVGWFMDRWRRK